MALRVKKFQKIIYDHYHAHGRRLAWRNKKTTPYQIVVSEIMLQQTQVDRVKVKYREFMKCFPTFQALADAKTSEVLKAWQGLGYNRRALALQRLAQIVVRDYNGKLPRTVEKLDALPGIGAATAGSIAAFAFNSPTIIIETNIRSVFIHFFFRDKQAVPDAAIQHLVEKTVDRVHPREWYWALMDYGSMLKKSGVNPSRRSRHYTKQSRFAGSHRQLRGQVLKLLVTQGQGSAGRLAKQLKTHEKNVRSILTELRREGFLKKRGRYYYIA